jgi:hypothetical protein
MPRQLIRQGPCRPMFIILIVCCPILKAQAFLDFIGQQARDAAAAAAYADAVTELAGEISPDGELTTGAKDISARADKLRRDTDNLKTLSQSTQNILMGPDWSSKRLDANIRSTSDYVKKIKRVIARIAFLGTPGVTALNGTEANISLMEIQKNQQAMILQTEDSKLRLIEKEHEENKSWMEFSQKQRLLRGSGESNGSVLKP